MTSFRAHMTEVGREIKPMRALEIAIAHYESHGMTDKRHESDCIELAGLIAEICEPARDDVKRTDIIPGLDDSLTALDLSEAIQPWVQKVRQELFGTSEVPFRSKDLAVKWLEKQGAAKARSNPLADKLYAQILERVQKFRELKPVGVNIIFSKTWLTIEYQKAKKRDFVFCATDKLERLAYAIGEMEKATRFRQTELLMHVLAGSGLLFPVGRVHISPLRGVYNLPSGGAIPRYEARFECFSPRELKKAHLAAFLDLVRRTFRITKTKRLTDQDRKLVDFFRRYGRPPKQGNLQYWSKVARQWNLKSTGVRRVSPDALRKRYERLLSRTQGSPS